MNELTLDGKIYVSSKHAAELTGYAKDYIGQMCREGRVEARLVGRNWYVLKSALEKHRFASKSDEEVPEEVPAAAVFASEVWEQPRYEAEEPQNLPAINRLAELPEEVLGENEEPGAVMSTIEAMQDAWKGWFTASTTDPDASGDTDIALETQNSLESEETPITIHTIARGGNTDEALNLRRIREYRIEESEEDESVVAEEVIRAHARAHYPLRAVLLVVIVAAIGVGYIGSGFVSESIASRSPFNFIAGVYIYNTDK